MIRLYTKSCYNYTRTHPSILVGPRHCNKRLYPNGISVVGIQESGNNNVVVIRQYRGEAGIGSSIPLSPNEQKLYEIAKPRSEEILRNHTRLPKLTTSNAAAATTTTTNSITTTTPTIEELELDIRRKRLIYRSKQRGWLEVDLLLGTWANLNVMKLNLSELDEFESFVNYETIDIYNIITLRLDVPDHLRTVDGTGIVERIQEWARSSPLGQADPEMYKKVKEESNLI